MRIAVIPARGGSKRIPRKNIRPFAGKPIICWSISAAQDAGCFDRVVVSTDDLEIAQVAQSAGAEVPFLREAKLANDHTTTIPVVADAIVRLGVSADTAVCCLYATAPFVRGKDLLKGLELLTEGAADYVVSVTSFSFPIQRALRRAASGEIEMFEPSNFAKRSQDLDEAWHDAGQFYWARAEVWTNPDSSLYRSNTFGLVLPRYRVQDIDSEEDWIRAETMMSALQAKAADA